MTDAERDRWDWYVFLGVIGIRAAIMLFIIAIVSIVVDYCKHK